MRCFIGLGMDFVSVFSVFLVLIRMGGGWLWFCFFVLRSCCIVVGEKVLVVMLYIVFVGMMMRLLWLIVWCVWCMLVSSCDLLW